ncbi:flavin-containing monooxygenase [Chelatococcus reniformis]|uniref:Monooxygenase n=1 Tax=Chelatococcus reniformis TaxID=1494448 RepID=A0A916UWX5_9HYPH|nr:NAD(P)/FAD-dependent oxidoreductase [Chelatococcus reniformis]GGC89188.1 putative monooxygenase [Chelatococcus reniformis]
MKHTRRLRVAVIGAGASGVMAYVKLKQHGHDDVQLFDKGDDFGGTWRDNTYPGLACDVPSHLYRYSFEPYAEWSRVCSSGPEILSYFKAVAGKHEVGRATEFGVEVLGAEFLEGCWYLETSKGPRGPFDAVVSAMGILRFPLYPDIAGRDAFAGASFHASRWDHSVALAGKRVGVIGTGSTAIQIVSATVDTVGELKMFQRTAQWIMPLPNKAIPEETKQRYRSDRAALEMEYARLADAFNGRFAAAVVGDNPEAYDRIARQCREHLATVRDPDLRARLTPDYEVGCKRLIMSDSFYEAIQRRNATLVTERIERIMPEGVLTSEGRLHALDVIVFATGYDAHTFVAPMEVRGRDGLSLAEAWADAAEAYLGVTVPGFPNWFMIGGPNSPIGNFSFIMTAERQFGYALALIDRLADDLREVSPTPEATKRFNEAIKAKMPDTIWVSGCRSWYMDRNGNIASWPWNYERFEAEMREPDLDHFEIVRQ